MNNNGTCPIWGTYSTISESSDFFYEVSSSRTGGLYKISRSVNDDAKWTLWSDLQKALLTTWLIDQRRQGAIWPEITAELTDKSWRLSRQRLFVSERADRLLKYLEEKSPIIGTTIECNSRDPEDPVFMEMLAWTESGSFDELSFLLKYLVDKNWTTEEVKAQMMHFTIITVEGYARLAELATKHVNSSQGFVAMWFDDSMTEAYENGIGPGVEDAGYSPRRIDEKPHVNKIDDEIIAEIRRSRFVVADFTHGDTGHRGGVYYEAGFAHGLGIPVFFTCRKDVLDKIHFDTRQYNHIVWETHEDLRKQLADRISRVIGDGPNKTPAAD
ncbi:MAG: hypothetical protein ACSLFL_03560 [Alphaproteobacteria bacterium]